MAVLTLLDNPNSTITQSPELFDSSSKHPERQYLPSNHLRCMYYGYLLYGISSERNQVVRRFAFGLIITPHEIATYRPMDGEKLFGS
jgi:hypothetical protein